MTFQDIAHAIAATARDEGFTVHDDWGNFDFVIDKDEARTALIVSDRDLIFLRGIKRNPGFVGWTETNVDAALSRGLDFIYC
jgi:hypothetical protein